MTPYYFWWTVGLALIALELVAPGFFLLWIGFAALVTGVLMLVVGDLWIVYQVVFFVVTAFASCVLYWKKFRIRAGASDAASTLNRRGEQLIGRCYVLETAIENGRGKARVGDSLWLVEGPDLPAGANVEVTGVHGATLVVRAA